MAWKLESDRPIYTQLLEMIEQKIITGEYPLGSKLPSVRELAAEASVNPNTMQRAMSELENRKLIITNRTAGRSVTDDANIIDEIRKGRANQYTANYIEKMTELNFRREEIIDLIREGDNKWAFYSNVRI